MAVFVKLMYIYLFEDGVGFPSASALDCKIRYTLFMQVACGVMAEVMKSKGSVVVLFEKVSEPVCKRSGGEVAYLVVSADSPDNPLGVFDYSYG